MGFEDRDYSRQSSGGGFGFVQWLMNGSVPLFTAFGIRVRAHSSLVVIVVLMLLFGVGTGFTGNDRILAAMVLFAVILLHEFGHCFGARLVGGTAEDILMTPLGGLAYAMAPRRPFPTFVTVAAGPLVNVVLLLGSAVVMYALGAKPPWNPWGVGMGPEAAKWFNVYWYAWWFFKMNYVLLLFNLLPIFPLDGGQLLQTLLWRPLGYYKSMLMSATIGLVGCVGLAIWGLTGAGYLMVAVAVSCFLTCWQMRAQLLAAGPWAFQEEEADYSAASWRPDSVVKPGAAKAEARAIAKAKAAAMAAAAEQAKIDRILEKVHVSGMNSLNWFEKRTLKQATERQRQQKVRR